ncbi:hypothetical protein VCV18_000526 [Metarhizium anisopliae]
MQDKASRQLVSIKPPPSRRLLESTSLSSPLLSSPPLLPSLTGLTGLTGLDKPRSDARSPAGTNHMPSTRSLTPDSYTAAWMA